MDQLYFWTTILILPMFIYSMITSSKVNSTFAKYDRVGSASNLKACEVARAVLDRAGLEKVNLQSTPGKLTDHFDPRNNTVYLSEAVYNSASVAAIGVATHECGHAIQHNSNYIPVKIRTAIFPVVNIGSRMALPLLLLAVFLEMFSVLAPSIASIVIYFALALYSFSTVFMLVTLPVEFNASSRAQKILEESEILTSDECVLSGKVLNAAAQTYVAAFAMSLLQLLRIIAIFGRRGGNKN